MTEMYVCSKEKVGEGVFFDREHSSAVLEMISDEKRVLLMMAANIMIFF